MKVNIKTKELIQMFVLCSNYNTDVSADFNSDKIQFSFKKHSHSIFNTHILFNQDLHFQIEVRDKHGQIVLTKALDSATDSLSEMIDLPIGEYSFTYSSGHNILTRNLVVSSY
ncbi:hypothetical protein V6R21_26055 [Limibacter armeniacum]|uniref:hypothetical protein n=1 Tax=Limibacter armeniacum TaxID=466084 RepID=UPI002FE67FEF